MRLHTAPLWNLPPRCIKYPHIAHIMAPAHCLYHKHLHPALRCNLLSRLYHSHQCTCTLPLSQAPSHPASLYLTFALTSPSHLFTLSHYNLFSHGVENRMSRFRKMRPTTHFPRIAFAESASQALPPHGLRAKISCIKYTRLHGVRLTTAHPRTALITSLSRRSAGALTTTYHRIASTTC